MSQKRTVLQSYVAEDFTFEVEKWWIPLPNTPIESYVGVALVCGDKVVLLSKARTQTLIESMQKAIGDKP